MHVCVEVRCMCVSRLIVCVCWCVEVRCMWSHTVAQGYIHIMVDIYACICIHMHIMVDIYACICIHMHIMVDIYACICIHIHAYIHTFGVLRLGACGHTRSCAHACTHAGGAAAQRRC